MTLGIFLVLVLVNPLVANSPTIQTERLLLVQENSLMATAIPSFPLKFANLASLSDNSAYTLSALVLDKYPEIADLLLCIAFNESGFNRYAIGDYGLAKGLFQIHTDKHLIGDNCAFDVECSTNFTAQKIKAGEGHLWTTYEKCSTTQSSF